MLSLIFRGSQHFIQQVDTKQHVIITVLSSLLNGN